MSVNFFTTHPLSVQDQAGKSVNLSNKDVAMIALATLVGTLFFGIGAIFGFLGSSYYFRKKKVTELSKNDPGANKVDKVGSQALNKGNTQPNQQSNKPDVSSKSQDSQVSPTKTPPQTNSDVKNQPKSSQDENQSPSQKQKPTEALSQIPPAQPEKTPPAAQQAQSQPTSSQTSKVSPKLQPDTKQPAIPSSQTNASQTSTSNIKKPESRSTSFKNPTPEDIDYRNLLLLFDKKLDEMKKKNLRDDQALLLFELLDEAMVSAEPRKIFQSLYEKEGNKTNNTGKWTNAKFPFFNKLLLLIPEENISRKNYDEGIRRMGIHIKDHQKPVLEQIYKDAMYTIYPRQSFSILIRNELEKGYGNQINGKPAWTINKIEYLEKDLLSTLPNQIIFPPPPQQKQDQGTFSSTINNPQNPPIPVPHSPATTNILNGIKSISASNLVAFYKIGPTACFGNFWICPNGITLGNVQFRCSEAAFQCQKICIAAAELERKIQNREMTKTTKMQEFLEDQKWKKFLTADGDRAFDLKKEYNKDYGQLFNNKFNAVEPSDWVVNKSCPQFPSLRDQVMWRILQAKIAQNPEFGTYLQATGSAYLLEHNEKLNRDIYWSDNHDGKGSNMLGRMLMALRAGQNIPSPTIPNSLEQAQIQQHTNIANNGLNYKLW